ncbi:MAG: glycerophosphoryl diester phosphodiesterase [Magnetovibrio sp.]|nr:glycerophosphoryl diester phosphodiesterase [Magnetovibrio sp.]
MRQDHPGHMPKIIGHRGACGHAPENTLVSIAHAAELGAQAVEFDATITQDGVAIVLHDYDVDRCSDGSGPVALKTFDEIKRLDAGSWFDKRFAGARIPTLHDALKLVADKGLRLNLELKPTLGWEEPTARIIAKVVQDVWPLDLPLLVSSMSPQALDTFHDRLPGVALGLITCAIPQNWHLRMRQHHCVALHCHHDFVTHDLVQEVHATGARLHVYTVNDDAKAKALFAMGVDAVFTDFPDRLAHHHDI